ncbi:hypothetical protein DIC82_16625 [Clostridium beijerinckii]|nr:hypothetical protein DIC82_16625 [Clostridium beijerinckii]
MHKKNNFAKENLYDLKTFTKSDKTMRKFIANAISVLLILYLIIIAIGSIILNIKFDELVITMSIISVVVAYFIARQMIYFRLIKYFKKLNNHLVEINEDRIEFISKNDITKLNRSDIRAIYSLKHTFFIITEGYCRNEEKKNIYFAAAISKLIFNSDEEYNTFFNSLEKDKLKELS